MSFVLDASIVGSWAFPDEGHLVARLALAALRTEEGVVPGLWWFEVRNILVINERRKRIMESETVVFLRELARLPVRIDRSPDETSVLRLARSHRLSVYDASYLELARREGLALASLDKELCNAARAEALPLLGEPIKISRKKKPSPPR
jgi:predicted nucleic acid-binding protein